MDTNETVAGLLADAEDFFADHKPKASEHLKAAYKATASQPGFPRIAAIGELLYANAGELSADLKRLAGRIAVFCHGHLAFGYAEDDRGLRIKGAMDRSLKVAGASQDKALDPEPKAEHLPPPVEPAA